VCVCVSIKVLEALGAYGALSLQCASYPTSEECNYSDVAGEYVN
jgi:hypothetical protein